VGGGADPDPNPSTIDEGYRQQYDKYVLRNKRLYDSLFQSGMNEPNFMAARDFARDCVDALGAMQKMLAEPQATQLAAVLDNYRRLYDGLASNHNIVTSQQLDSWSKEVRNFSPSKVTLVNSIPPTVNNNPPPQQNPPVVKNNPPPQNPNPNPVNPPPQMTNGGKTPDWVAYMAWERLHTELEDKWTKAEDCKPTYERLMDVMQLMQNNVPKEKLSRLITYTDYYQRLYEDTRGFKEVPKGANKQNVLDDLHAVASGMKLYFNPDRK
jgi:hypothetical protein